MHPILHEIRSLDTSRKALRSFGLVVGGVLLGIGAFVWWRHDGAAGTATYVLAGVGGALVLIGLAAPRVLRPVYRAWMALAVVLGFVMTRVLLTLVFTLVVLPIGLVMRLAGRDPLHRRLDPEASTYWIRKAYDADDPTRLEKYY